MNKNILVAGSILSADLSRLKDEVLKFQDWGLPVLHIDVMDGHFAPNLTFGPVVFEGLRGLMKIPVDIHLMVLNPMDYLDRFADIFNFGNFKQGRNWYGIHVELYVDAAGKIEVDKLKKDLLIIVDKGFLVTLVLNPDTKPEVLEEFMMDNQCKNLVDKILIMTVWPGFSGQEMITECLQKIKFCYDKFGGDGCWVAVDGGVNQNTIKEVLSAGADFVVSGSYLMQEPEKELFYQKLNILRRK